jgi:DNA-binding transcriptional LysR family regulator
VGVVLQPALQAASLQSDKRAIGDEGFTLISELTIEAERRAGMLVGLPVRGVDLQRELHAIRRSSQRAPAVAREFWNWLAAGPAAGRPPERTRWPA